MDQNHIITTQDEIWMDKAIEQAYMAKSHHEVPIGCVVVHDGSIVSSGYNLRETQHNPVAHAELIAIHEASQKLKRWRLSDCTLYVTLEPCFMCAGAIVLARIPRVVFGAFDPKAGASGSLANVLQDSRLNHRCLVSNGVRGAECSEILKTFFREKRLALKASPLD